MLRTPPPTALGTYSLVVTTAGTSKLSPVVMAIAVQSSYASAVWLQAFSGTTVPANGSVPIMDPIAVAALGRNIGKDFMPIGLPISANGLVLVASSTEGTLTKDVAATLDITAFIEEYEFQPLSTDSVVGDLTTARKSLTVWADNVGPKVLRRAIVINNAASTRYMCLYAENTPDTGSIILAWQRILAGQAVEMDFGTRGGTSPFQQVPGEGDHDACVLQGQADLTPGHIVAATDFNIKAYYAAQ